MLGEFEAGRKSYHIFSVKYLIVTVVILDQLLSKSVVRAFFAEIVEVVRKIVP